MVENPLLRARIPPERGVGRGGVLALIDSQGSIRHCCNQTVRRHYSGGPYGDAVRIAYAKLRGHRAAEFEYARVVAIDRLKDLVSRLAVADESGRRILNRQAAVDKRKRVVCGAQRANGGADWIAPHRTGRCGSRGERGAARDAARGERLTIFEAGEACSEHWIRRVKHLALVISGHRQHRLVDG